MSLYISITHYSQFWVAHEVSKAKTQGNVQVVNKILATVRNAVQAKIQGQTSWFVSQTQPPAE